MLAVPPPTSEPAGAVETVKTVLLRMVLPTLSLRNTVFGSVRMAWVIVPAATNLLRSCGSLAVFVFDVVWLGNGILLPGLPIANGVMSTDGIFGAPGELAEGARHWALMVVPCGMDAMRVSDSPSFGSTVVAGTCIQSPGSKWMAEGAASAFPVRGLVTSLMACTYGTPLRKISFCPADPRLGMLPRELENDSVSVVRLSSRTLSELTGMGNFVPLELLFGRNIELKPFPV